MSNSLHTNEVIAVAESCNPDLAQRLGFIYELDRLKQVLRQNVLADGSRRENSAEHSWHLAMTALTMQPYAVEPVDTLVVVKTLLVHDIVEIDAGDTDIFDSQARADNVAAEQAAAIRLFGLLPDPDGTELLQLWQDYEAGSTAEARFAYACDRLQPFMLNLAVGGSTWEARGITATDVKRINQRIGDGLEHVWPVAQKMLDAVVAKGLLQP